MSGILRKRKHLKIDTQIQTGRIPCEKEGSHLLAKERGLEQILPSQPLEGINPTDTLILNF
jgi:hypothetical protein